MHIVQLLLQAHGARYLEISEAIDFRRAEEFLVEDVDAGALLQLLVDVDDVLELVEEPLVYLGELVYLVDGVAPVHGLGNHEDALVSGLAQGCVDVGNHEFLVLHKAVHALAYHAHALLDGLLKGAANGHHLAYRLHGGAQLLVHSTELAQVPTWNLAHHIVERWLKECRSGLGDGVLQFEESISDAQLGGDEGQGITRGL